MWRLGRWIAAATAAATLTTCGSGEARTEAAIRTAVERQLAVYPHSTLRDLYKNFFQDRFGPGHIVADTAAAGRYLRAELAEADSLTGAAYEPTGYEGRYLRVNLSVIRDGSVSYERYFDAFVRSVNQIEPPTAEAWRSEWQQIDGVIRAMGLDLADEAEDRRLIAEALAAGHFAMHHSRLFNAHYAPHYRIIERSIFEREILPALQHD